MTEEKVAGNVFRRTAATLILRVIGAISGILFSFVVTQVLSVEEAGIFFLAVAIITVLWNMSSLGMPLALVRFVGVFHSRLDYAGISGVMTVAAKRVLVAASLIALVLFLLSGPVTKALGWAPERQVLLQIMATAIPLIAVSNLIAFSFQGVHRSLTSILLQHILTPLGSCVIIALLVLGSLAVGLSEVAGAMVISAAACLVTALLLWFRDPRRRAVARLEQDGKFLSTARPIYVSNLMGLLVRWSSILIAGFLVSASDVAYLTIAQRLAMLTSFVLVATNLVVAPRFAASFANKDMDELRTTSLFGSRLMLLSAVPMLSIMIAFPEWLLGFFGDEYVKGAHLLQILAVGQFINVATGSVGFLLNMTGHEKDMRNVTLVTGSVSVALALLLTFAFGVTGSAVAASIASASQNLLAAYFVRLRLGINIFKVI